MLSIDHALHAVSPESRMECHCGARACRGLLSTTRRPGVDVAQAANVAKPLRIHLIGASIENASHISQCFVQWQPNARPSGERFGHEERLCQIRLEPLAAAIRHLLLVRQVIESTYRDDR